MPVTATATPSLNLSYTMVDTTADRSVSENASVGYTLQQFSNGTGYSEVNMGVTLSGVLERGLPFNIDFTLAIAHCAIPIPGLLPEVQAA